MTTEPTPAFDEWRRIYEVVDGVQTPTCWFLQPNGSWAMQPPATDGPLVERPHVRVKISNSANWYGTKGS